jgi:hypothetical protein
LRSEAKKPSRLWFQTKTFQLSKHTTLQRKHPMSVSELVGKLFCCVKVYAPCLFSDAPESSGAPLVGFGKLKGPRVKISNFYIAGEGTAIVKVPLIQNKAYWEFKVKKSRLSYLCATPLVFKSTKGKWVSLMRVFVYLDMT